MSVVDLDRLAVTATVSASTAAGHVGIDPVRDRAYCVNFGAGSLTMIDGELDGVIGEVPVGEAPCKMVVDAARGEIRAALTTLFTRS